MNGFFSNNSWPIIMFVVVMALMIVGRYGAPYLADWLGVSYSYARKILAYLTFGLIVLLAVLRMAAR